MTFPTASDKVLGGGKFSMGPAAVGLYMGGPWVVGVLANQQWSFAGWSHRGVNALLVQPFVSYNIKDGWYLVTAPIITGDFATSADNHWTVPVGGGGKLWRVGKVGLPTNRSCRRSTTPRPGVRSRLATALSAAIPLSALRGHMKSTIRWRSICVFVATLLAALCVRALALAQADPLQSWNDGAAKQAIVRFVQATTDQASPTFVPPAARIAAFDQDGTTWVEQPMYTQVVYCLERVGVLAKAKPELRHVEPFKTVLSGDRAAMARLTMKDLQTILAATLTGMTVGDFKADVGQWMASAKHPRWNRLYTELTYEPMLEVMRYLRDNGFKTYIVTGGGQDFVRVFSETVYEIPREQVVGTMGGTAYGYAKDGKPVLTKEPKLLLNDDNAGKPQGIYLMIGRRPVAAFGNSIGDRQMLEYTGGGDGARLMMLVLHDDAQREYAYGPAQGLPATKVGTFPQALYDEAKKKDWTIISMKNDWNRIFSFE